MRRITALLLFVIALALPVVAQPAAPAEPPAAPAAPPTLIANVDSAETREQLRELLRRLPPEVGKALKLDPTLWSNQTYLAHYPALAAFIVAHPEVAHSPGYFLESVWIPGDPVPETNNMRMWGRVMESLSIFSVMIFFGGLFAWLIRTAIDHRRWSRLSRIQAEVHNKLLDRFAANEDLLAYVKTTAGRRFLEAAPIPIEGPRAVGAPMNRVLWSTQAGVVLTAAGLGLTYVSNWSVDKDIAQPLSAIGVLAIAIGLGFVVSAALSFILSRKLGLWQPPHDPALEISAGE
jgi:hypothetical protein